MKTSARRIAVRLSLAVSLGSLAFASSAWADASMSDSTTQLGTVDVIGSRTAADTAVLPQGAVVIDRTQIERMPANNLAEVLRSVGGVTISSQYGDVGGSYATADIGGFGVNAGQNTLILLNGRRLNTMDLSGVNLSSIPLSAIERIEILPGSGSVLYGSGAVGGVINIVTRQHYDDAGHIEGTVGSFGTHGGAVQGSFSNAGTDGLLSVSRLGTDNYRDNNESWQSNAFGDLRHVDGRSTYYLTTLANRQQIGLPGAVSNSILAQDPTQAQTPNDWAQDKTVSVLPGMRYALTDQMTLHLDSGFRVRRQEAGYYNFGNYFSQTTDRTLNLSPRLTGKSDLGVPQNWTAGIDYYRTHYHADSQSGFGDTHERYQRSTRALYGQDSFGLTNSTWLTLGVRHEWLRTTEENNPGLLPDPDQQVGMWSAGVRQSLSDMFSVFAKAERNARYATVDDLRTGPLATQTGKLYSLGASWQKAGQYSTLTLWQGHYHDEIAYDPINYINVNLDPTRRSGVTLNSYWQLDKALWLAVSGTYQEAHFDAGTNADNNVPLVPRVTAYARFDWQALPQLALSLSERYQGRQYMDNDQSNTFGQQIPAYRWMDIAATYRPTGKKSVFVTATLHNAEDRKEAYDYAAASTSTPGAFNAYPLPGRYVIVTAGVDF